MYCSGVDDSVVAGEEATVSIMAESRMRSQNCANVSCSALVVGFPHVKLRTSQVRWAADIRRAALLPPSVFSCYATELIQTAARQTQTPARSAHKSGHIIFACLLNPSSHSVRKSYCSALVTFKQACVATDIKSGAGGGTRTHTAF